MISRRELEKRVHYLNNFTDGTLYLFQLERRNNALALDWIKTDVAGREASARTLFCGLTANNMALAITAIKEGLFIAESIQTEKEYQHGESQRQKDAEEDPDGGEKRT